MTVAVKWLLVANLTFGLDAVAWAQDSNSDFGKSLFVSACSNCHVTERAKGRSVTNSRWCHLMCASFRMPMRLRSY